MMNQVKFFRSLWLVLITLLTLTACSEQPAGKQGRGKGKRPQVKPVAVEVAHAEVGLAAAFYVTTATVEPSSDAQVFARAAGVVREIFAEEGDSVKAGDILLQLEDDDQTLRVKQAKQKLASAEREYLRLSKMSKAGVVSPTEFEATRTTFETAQTELELAELALSYTKVMAPFDGRLVWREVDLGAHVLSGNLLFRVMAIEPLLIRVHIPASRTANIEVDQPVNLTVDALGVDLIGNVDLISPIVDPDTGTVKVTIRLEEQAHQVRPGDFVSIKLITDNRDNAMLLPSLALIEERGEYYLYVEENNKAVRKDVKVGYVIDDKTEVISGITLQDKVVVKGQRNLNDGNPLKVFTAEEAQNLLSQKNKKNKPNQSKGKRSDKKKDKKAASAGADS